MPPVPRTWGPGKHEPRASLPRASAAPQLGYNSPMMEPASPRHHCLIYEGAPSRHLTSLAAVVFNKLKQNHRCLYLNTRPMVAGMRSYLAAAGVDVTREIQKGSLIMSSQQDHLVNDQFDIDQAHLYSKQNRNK